MALRLRFPVKYIITYITHYKIKLADERHLRDYIISMRDTELFDALKKKYLPISAIEEAIVSLSTIFEGRYGYRAEWMADRENPGDEIPTSIGPYDIPYFYIKREPTLFKTRTSERDLLDVTADTRVIDEINTYIMSLKNTGDATERARQVTYFLTCDRPVDVTLRYIKKWELTKNVASSYYLIENIFYYCTTGDIWARKDPYVLPFNKALDLVLALSKIIPPLPKTRKVTKEDIQLKVNEYYENIALSPEDAVTRDKVTAWINGL